MKFKDLSVYFDKISKNSSRLEITRILADLFEKLSSDEIEKVVYLLQGRISPEYEGIEFGISEKLLIKAIILALNIDKVYFEKEYKKIGDLGETVEKIKKQIISFEEKDFDINEIYDYFYKIAYTRGSGSQEIKLRILADIISKIDPLSSRFLVRIPIGNIRMGFSDMTILDAYSWMIKKDKSLRSKIEKAYHVRPQLGYLGKLIKEKGIGELEKISPKVFIPIIMMKAERLSNSKEIIDHLKECFLEPKFDGFRLQIHFKKIKNFKDASFSEKKEFLSEIKIFSRGLEDVTYMYPDLVDAVKKQINADEIIFEGEAVGYDEKNNKFLNFQETVQRKRKYKVEELVKKIPLRFFAFDVLYKNQENLINKPFFERRKYLENSINTDNNIKKDTILIIDQIKVEKDYQIDQFFKRAINKRLEGIMAKKIDGVYKPGAREWNWIKYKISYSDKIIDTIDCIVMGYDIGKGKRTVFGIGAFLVGIYDKKNQKFVTVSKIGTGLTDEEWKNLKTKISKYEVKEKPFNYEVDKSMECDVWVSPGIVVEIRADEITRSPVHTAGRKLKISKDNSSLKIEKPGFALRFPRLERFREDRKPEDITTLEELENLFKEQKR